MEKQRGDDKIGGKEGKTIYLHIEILVIFFILPKHHPDTWAKEKNHVSAKQHPLSGPSLRPQS